MARTSGTYKLSSNLEMEVGAPLDARDIVLSVSDMTASGTFPYHYIGMETYVVGTNKKYRLIGSNPTVLANWEEVGTGGADFDLVEVTEAQWAELTPEQKADPTKLYFRPEANGLFRTLQDNGSATAFVPDAIPTGRTATSVINNMLVNSSDVVEGYYVDEVQFYTSDVVVILGYYDDGNFYEDSAHTVLIVGEEGPKYYDKTSDDFYAYTEGSGYAVTTAPTAVEEKSNTLYVDLTTNTMYRYDTTEEEFVSTSAAIELDGPTSSKYLRGDGLWSKPLLQISEADYALLSTEQKNDPSIVYFRPEADELGYDIQDNSSATSLTTDALPTGGTITSFLNSNLGFKYYYNSAKLYDIVKDVQDGVPFVFLAYKIADVESLTGISDIYCTGISWVKTGVSSTTVRTILLYPDGRKQINLHTNLSTQVTSILGAETGTITKVKTNGTFQQFCCYKVGSVVCASARHYDLNDAASGHFFTLPVGFRPPTTAYSMATIVVNNVSISTRCYVDTDGQVVISYSSGQNLSQIAFSATFPIL